MRALRLVVSLTGLLPLFMSLSWGQGTSWTPADGGADGLTVAVDTFVRNLSGSCTQNESENEFEPFWAGGSFVGASASLEEDTRSVCSLQTTTADGAISFEFTSSEILVSGSARGTAQGIPLTSPPSGGYEATVGLVFTFEVAALSFGTLDGEWADGGPLTSVSVLLERSGTIVYHGAPSGPLPLALQPGTHTLQVLATIASTPTDTPASLGTSFDVSLILDPEQPSNGIGRGRGAPRSGGSLLDETPPVILGLEVQQNGGGDVTLRWSSDEPTRGFLDYGLSPGYDNTIDLGPEFVRDYEVPLSGLFLDSTYHYRIRLRDGMGNHASTPNQSFDTPPLGNAEVTGSRTIWYPLTLSFHGPQASELDDDPNPFLDYRMVVEFLGPSGQSYFIPGFFDGDGAGGASGDIWRVRFAPDEAGHWVFIAHFVSGVDIACDLDLNAGTPLAFDGEGGSVEIFPAADDAEPEGFYPWGKLEYTGGHYLKFRDGPYFIKAGCGSPENFLGYVGFDNTFDQGGADTTGLDNGLHRYDAHVADWGPAGLGDANDPLFTSADTGDDSRGIIGALNYLSSRDVNAIYFLPMNLGGDGQETYPFVGASNTSLDKTHYDISKLAQWNEVFEHATRRGILLHFVLAEVEEENLNWLDGGTLGPERKLFYRELIARFGYNLAIKWNLCEETHYPTEEVEAFAGYLQSLDPYDHPIGFHTLPLPPTSENPLWDPVLGDSRFSINSIQANISDTGGHVEYWREQSAAAGRPWVVEIDEITGGVTHINAWTYRLKALYDVLFSGGHIEFYMGYFPLPVGGDLRVEDFRTREEMWDYASYARRLMEDHLPFWEMEPMDELVQGETIAADGGGAEVFAKPGDTYAIYYPTASATGTLDLTGFPGPFEKRWFDPRNGVFVGSPETIDGNGLHTIGEPPGEPVVADWVVLVQQ